uniref:RRM domain-containing protein n=1 Tax=Podarcis muralis TaxID=64176 RepID=A0A670J710_PODMU
MWIRSLCFQDGGGSPSWWLFGVFVACMPWTVGPNEVKQYFAQFGSVRKCMPPFDKETGFHKGFCWVGFSTEGGLQDPDHLQGQTIALFHIQKITIVQRDVTRV